MAPTGSTNIAYFNPELKDAMRAKQDPRFERIRSAGPWHFAPSSVQGKRGVLAFWSKDGAVPTADAFGEPRPCSDGLIYLPPQELPDQRDLARRNIPHVIDITTARGRQLSIPLAASAPHYVNFGASEYTDPADEFAALAYAVFDRFDDGEKRPKITDPDVIRLVGLALMQTYRVTTELLDDLRWITSADIDPILCAIMGSDPKALPGVGDTSPSSPPGASATAG